MVEIIDFYTEKDKLKQKNTKSKWLSLPIDEELWDLEGVLIKEKIKDGKYHYYIPKSSEEIDGINLTNDKNIKWLPMNIIELYLEEGDLPPILG